METAIILTTLFIVTPVLLITALVLKLLAKNFAKIENATFKNSFLVVLVSGLAIFISMSPIGLEEFMELGFIGVIIFLTVVQTSSYTVCGKYVWKTTFKKSFKAILIPMIIQTIIFALLLNYINGMI